MRAFFCLCSLRISPEETSENVCECDVRWNRHRCFIGNSPKAMIIKLSLPDFALLSFGPYWWPPLPLHHSYLPSPYTEISPSFFHMCSRTLSISISFAISLEMSCLRKCQPKSVWGWSRCSGRAHLCKNKPVNGAIVFFFDWYQSLVILPQMPLEVCKIA